MDISLHSLKYFITKIAHGSVQLAEKAGIPPGVINVVTSSRDNASSVGKVLCQHPLIAKISFTGSTFVGKVRQLFKHLYLRIIYV